MILNYRFGRGATITSSLCTSLEEPDVIISDNYENQVYRLSMSIVKDENKITITVIGDTNRPFTTDRAVMTFEHSGDAVHVDGANAASPLVRALGDKPIRETDIIGILSDGLTLSRLVIQTLASIDKERMS